MKARKMDVEEAVTIVSELSYCENPQYRAWQQACRSNREFYFGEQVSKEDRETLEARGQYLIIINKIRKSIRGLVGLLSGAIPKFGALSKGEEDWLKADIVNTLLDYAWSNSGGIGSYKKLLKRAAVDNIAYLQVMHTSDDKIRAMVLSYDDVIVSPNSTDSMFRDASLVATKRYVPIEVVKAKYGIDDLKSDVKREIYGDEYQELDGRVRDIAKIELNERKMFLEKMFSADKQYVLVYEVFKKKSRVDEKGVFSIYITKQTVIGHDYVYEEEYPETIKEYPIIPLFVEDTENPYKIGEVHFLRDLQMFINKTFGITIANAQMMSNPKLLLTEDALTTNKDEFLETYAQPGGVNFIAAGATPPIVVEGQPLSNAFFQLYLEAKNEMEWNTIPNDMLGYGRVNQDERKSYLLEQKESVIESFSDFMSIIDTSMIQLARVVIEHARAFLSEEKLISVVDPDRKVEQILKYRQEGLDVNDPNSVKAFVQNIQKEGEDEEYAAELLEDAAKCDKFANALEAVMKMDMSEDNDIFIVPGSYSTTRDLAMLRLMMELSEIGAIDPSAVLKYAPVQEKGELIQRFDELMSLRANNQELQTRVEAYEGMIEKQDREKAKMEADNYVAERKVKQHRQEAEIKLKAYLHKQRDQLLTKEKMIELQALIKEYERKLEEAEKLQEKREREGVPISELL